MAEQIGEHVGDCNPQCNDTGHVLLGDLSKMKCDACPIEMLTDTFARLVADGWDQRHTFQREEFNGGKVIACTGHWSLL